MASIRTGWSTVGLLVAFFAVALVAMALDDRSLLGSSVWSKPVKFNGSFALHMATLMLFVALLSSDAQRSWLLSWIIALTSGAVLVELFYIYLQASRGEESHFNLDTPLDTLLYFGLMGGAALVVMLGTIALGLLVWLRSDLTIGAGLKTGAVLGAIVGSLATLVTAGAMASTNLTPDGRWIGGDLSHATGLPLLGWSTTGGDLRVPHFFATHMIQGLPIVGWLADRFLKSWSVSLVWLAMIIGLAIITLTFNQALAGEPFLVW